MPVANNWAMFVAADGNRFVNEAVWNSSPTAEVDSVWVAPYLNIPYRPRNVWAIVDTNGAAAINWSLTNFQKATLVNVAPNLNSSMVAWSNTISGLADQMSISETNLQAAVTRYNGFASTGVDTDFGRPKGFNPINAPPYLAAKLSMNAHDQCNGVRVNTSMRVLDAQRTLLLGPGVETQPIDTEPVIPHLYACGELAGGFFGAARGHGKIGSYVLNGRVAGTKAAAETPLS
jgi:hypothetical protein